MMTNIYNIYNKHRRNNVRWARKGRYWYKPGNPAKYYPSKGWKKSGGRRRRYRKRRY